MTRISETGSVADSHPGNPEWDHHTAVNGDVLVHYVVAKPDLIRDAPTVVLCHGFPHFWFTWHRQISALTAAGYQVIAPDMRGMGRTSAPKDVELYSPKNVVSDLIAVLDDAEIARAVFVGFDFGAGAVYDLCHWETERAIAVIGMENPFMGTGGSVSPLAAAEFIGTKKHFLHMHYFQQIGVAEASLDPNAKEFLSRVFWALSADYHYLDVWQHPPGTAYLDALPTAPALPWAWLSESEMTAFSAEYDRTGFAGGLAWYRVMDIAWKQRRESYQEKNPVPFYFIYSDHDPDLEGFHGKDPLDKLGRHHAEVRMVRSVPKAGHLMHLEATQDCNIELRACLQDAFAKDQD